MARSVRGSMIFGVALGAALLVSVFNSLSGRGDERPRESGLVSEMREVDAFSGIEFSGIGNVTVSLGSEPSLEVRAPGNLLRVLRTRVDNDTLKISTTRNTRLLEGRSVSYHVVTPSLERISLSGSGDVRAEAMTGDDLELELSGSGDLTVGDLRADDLEVDLSGAGDVQLSGRATEQTVTLSGVGDYRACALSSESAEVEVSGVGDALLWANRRLDAEVSGVDSVRYRGEPEVDTDVSGVGSVSRLESCAQSGS